MNCPAKGNWRGDRIAKGKKKASSTPGEGKSTNIFALSPMQKLHAYEGGRVRKPLEKWFHFQFYSPLSESDSQEHVLKLNFSIDTFTNF